MRMKVSSYLIAYLATVCLAFHVTDAVYSGPGRHRAPCRPGVYPALLGTASRANAATGDPAEEIQREVVDPYVEVRVPGGTGSGTVIWAGTEKLVLTAGHVVGESKTVTLFKQQKNGTTLLDTAAEVVARSGEDERGGLDLALVRPSIAPLLKAAMYLGAGEALHVGEDAWYVGSGGGFYQNLDKSIINRTGWKPQDQDIPAPFFLTNGNGYYGHSGSAVFVRRGGQYLVAGVVLRIKANYPKTPVLCREPTEVAQFIASYLGTEDQEDE